MSGTSFGCSLIQAQPIMLLAVLIMPLSTQDEHRKEGRLAHRGDATTNVGTKITCFDSGEHCW